MIQANHIKYRTISGLLLLCAIMLSTTEDSLYAQITSIPEKSGGSSSDTDGSNNNDDSSDSSSGSGSDDDDGSSGSSDSSDTVDSSDGGQETTGEQTNDMTTSEVETNPISDTIIQNVTDELTAVGITDFGF
jgi:hypothetical protein